MGFIGKAWNGDGQDGGGGFGKTIENAWNGAKQGVSDAVSGGSQWVGDAWNNAGPWVTDAWNNGSQFVEDGVGGAEEVGDKAWRQAGKYTGEFLNTVSNTLGEGKSAPPPPDFDAAAGRGGDDSKANVGAQTMANRPDQTNAFGGQVRWTKNPDGSWGQSQSFGGPLQDAANMYQRQMFAQNSKPMMDGSSARDQAINGAYSQATSRLDPQWDQRQATIQNQLVNQGLDPTSEAYQRQMSNFGRDRNDAYSSAMNGAIGQGTEAGNAAFAQNMAARNNPMQQLLSMQGFLGMPGIQNAGLAQAPDWLGAAGMKGNYQLGATEMKNKGIGDMLSATGTAVGAALMSDERVKEDIHRTGKEVVPGVPLATFRYKGNPQEYAGVIAQDLEKVAPEKVHRGPGGVRMVDAEFAPFAIKKGKR